MGIIYAVLLSAFDLRLLFSDTILTGGDSASWYQVLHKLKNVYLPELRAFGFSQSNFFGYMEGQQYFPLPFLAAALAGYAMPLTVALKLATVAGGMSLPLTMFLAVKSLSGSAKEGAKRGVIAAALSLPFLFNESYTMFGGNWLSTFAGEFCFSWAIALLPLFAASVEADRSRGRTGFGSGILLGLIGMSHLFVFMPAFFLPFFPALGALPRVIAPGGGKSPAMADAAREETDAAESRLIGRMALTYGTAFCLMGFWFLPMAATRGWAQSIAMIWHFSSPGDFARQTLAAAWLPAVVFLAATAAAARSPRPRSLSLYFGYGIAACAFLFAIAPGLGVPDIRFVPTALLLCATGVAALLPAPLTRRWIATFVVLALCAGGAGLMARNAGAWYRWNYSGYEAKSQWPALREIARKYAGDADSGRILWEKQNQRDNADFGSERGFENLELFTGRPSAEGIHYGSSFMARAVTYLQSAYSLNPVDPEAERIYSIVEPDSWPARFRQANARHIITHSPEITAMFAAHPDFRLDSKAGKFSVFEFKGFPGSYVEVLAREGVGVAKEGPGGWKADYYRFFRDWELMDRPFVSRRFLGPGPSADFGGSVGSADGKGTDDDPTYDDFAREAREALAARTGEAGKVGLPVPPASSAMRVSGEHVDDRTVRFSTPSPGMPHIVRISFAPGWRSSRGEKIYPVAPGFMLIFPSTRDVELIYGRTGWEIAGIVLSLGGTPLFFLVSRRLPRRSRGRPLPWRGILLASYLVFAGSAALLGLKCFTGPAAIARDIGEARTLDLSRAESRERALILVSRWATPGSLERYDNMLAFDAYRIKAAVLARQGRQADAEALLGILRERYRGTRPVAALHPTT